MADPRYPWLSMPGDGNPVWERDKTPTLLLSDITEGCLIVGRGDSVWRGTSNPIALECLTCDRNEWRGLVIATDRIRDEYGPLKIVWEKP